MNKLIYFTAIAVSSSMLLACSQNQTTSSDPVDQDTVNVETGSEGPVVFKDEIINKAYTSYILLANALVASNVESAQKASSGLSKALDQIKGCQNTSDLAKNIAGSSDLITQRKDFTPLSADFIALIKHADVEEGKVFVQYCPMANAGKGGYWMASSDKIKNPYYGDAMLNCGEVKETFSKN